MDLQLGLVPVVDDRHTRTALDRVAERLAAATGRRCSIHAVVSPNALRAAYAGGEVNLVWSSPTLALGAPELKGAVPVATCVRQGLARYHGVVFVRRDASVRVAADLRGRTMAWVAPTSAAGYIFPRVALAAQGLPPRGLFSEERFLDTHGAVVLAVIDGHVDAGATFAVFEDGDALRPMVRAGFVDLGYEDEVRVVLTTPPIPSDLFVATPALSASLGPRLHQAIESTATDDPEAFHRVFGADGVVPPDLHALGELRRQVEDARALGILE
ncbi:MAG: phosphate/phosphite/phosphonate ABC transporter substrate-binding protein [Myxococcales bacterium]|nr:phosphate/phosphite/phosphonate ABC transporter substrate-binding protein [Myxococcales bacterium]